MAGIAFFPQTGWSPHQLWKQGPCSWNLSEAAVVAAFMCRDRSAPSPTLLSSCMSRDTWEPIGRLCRQCMAGRPPWSARDCSFLQVSWWAALHGPSAYMPAALPWSCSSSAAAPLHTNACCTEARALHSCRPQNTLIKMGTYKIKKNNQKNTFLSAECMQQSQHCFQEETFICKGLVQENRTIISEAWGQRNTDNTFFAISSTATPPPFTDFWIIILEKKLSSTSKAINHGHETRSSFLPPFRSAAPWRQ